MKKNYCDSDGMCNVIYFPDCSHRLPINMGGPRPVCCHYYDRKTNECTNKQARNEAGVKND